MPESGDVLKWPRKAASLALRPVWLLAGALLYLAALALSPWRTLRVGLLKHDRIGHFAMNTELFLRARAAGRFGARDLFLAFSGEPANRQLFDMIRRRLTVLRFPLSRVIYDRGIRPFFKGSRFAANLERHSNEFFELNNVPPQLSFTAEEEERGRGLLNSLGIPPGEPFVCFHSRDSTYLDRMHAYRTRAEWSYHDYRDCSIENYLPAVRELAGRGIHAVRMGHGVAVAVPTEPRVVDYAVRHRSDFGDIYLVARCKFYLGNTAGLVCVPPCFGVPVAWANLVPIGYPPWRSADLFIPKKHWDLREDRLLSVREIFERKLDRALRSKQYADAGVELRENSPAEIAALAEEMNARIDGTWTETAEDARLQKRYRDALPAGHPARPSPASVGAVFLRENPGFLA